MKPNLKFKRMHSIIIAQVAQVAEKIYPVLFEQRVFSIINKYAEHKYLVCSMDRLYTSDVKVDHIAISNNTIYLTDINIYTLYMYNLATCNLIRRNFAYTHWTNRKLEPFEKLVKTIPLNHTIDNVHVENDNIIINMGHSVIRHNATNSYCYSMDKYSSDCYFNKLMYRIIKDNDIEVLIDDCKFVKLGFKHFRLYVGYYIIVTEILESDLPSSTKMYIYSKDLVFIGSFTQRYQIITKLCISKRFIYSLSLYNNVYVRELATIKNLEVMCDIKDIFTVGDVLYTLNQYNTVSKWEFS
jgi:hypothetical protein